MCFCVECHRDLDALCCHVCAATAKHETCHLHWTGSEIEIETQDVDLAGITLISLQLIIYVWCLYAFAGSLTRVGRAEANRTQRISSLFPHRKGENENYIVVSELDPEYISFSFRMHPTRDCQSGKGSHECCDLFVGLH